LRPFPLLAPPPAPATSARISSSEHELRRAKQREYAEQQLRVEAEDRCLELERESHVEIERLSRRLSSSERRAGELAGQLERVQRQLAEAEQAAAELSAVRGVADGLHERLAELERRAVELRRGLEAERAARERTERLLESMRRGHRALERLVGELRGVVGRLRVAVATVTAGDPTETERLAEARPDPSTARHRAARDSQPPSASGRVVEEADRGEMAEALAAAVERLRARVEDVGEAAAGADEGERERPVPASGRASPPGSRPAPHKHSASLLTRLRIRRKERRARRSAAGEPPSMQSQ
jgi:chromosome segregation ATPase